MKRTQQTETETQIKRKPQVLNQFGIGKTTLHSRIQEGLMPPPIILSKRSVGWLSNELDQTLKFMIAGKSHDDIRALISHMIEQRKNVA